MPVGRVWWGERGEGGGAGAGASVVVGTSSDPAAEPEDPAESRAIAWMVGEGPVATLPPRASSPTNPLAHGARTGGAADGLRRRRGHRRARLRSRRPGSGGLPHGLPGTGGRRCPGARGQGPPAPPPPHL